MILYMVEVYFIMKILFQHKDLMIIAASILPNNVGCIMKVVFKKMIKVEMEY